MLDNFHQYLARQCAVGREKFGPGHRSLGVQEHIRSEFDEINSAETNTEKVAEWTDVVILAMDGLLRSTRELLRERLEGQGATGPVADQSGRIIGHNGEPTNDVIAAVALSAILEKQGKNELRDFGDWRGHPEDKLMQHTPGDHD